MYAHTRTPAHDVSLSIHVMFMGIKTSDEKFPSNYVRSNLKLYLPRPQILKNLKPAMVAVILRHRQLDFFRDKTHNPSGSCWSRTIVLKEDLRLI